MVELSGMPGVFSGAFISVGFHQEFTGGISLPVIILHPLSAVSSVVLCSFRRDGCVGATSPRFFAAFLFPRNTSADGE